MGHAAGNSNTTSSYVRSLPSNTIYFDDFSRGSSWFGPGIVGTSANVVTGLNYTKSFDGNVSLGIYNPNANTAVLLTKAIASTSRIIGFSAWFSFNNAMYVTNDGQAPEFQMCESQTTGRLHCGFVEYRPGKGQWVAFGDPSNPDASTASSPNVLYTFPGSDGARSGYMPYNSVIDTPYYQNSWHFIKFVVNFSNDKYLSMCFDTACAGNVTNYFAGDWLNGVQNPYPEPNTILLGLKETNDASALTANALFSNILITDETPGQPNVIQFGLVGASSIFTVIMVATALMYSASGMATVARVFGAKTKGPLTSPKFIVTTGVAGTLGFLLMIIIGAAFTNVCPAGFVCKG